MLAHERQAELERLLQEQGTVVVSDLARRWHVSEMTIRRDLKALEERGVVSRVHGGAVAAGALRWRSRLDQDRATKQAAAAKLAQHLPEMGCIYLDGSTTIYHLAEYLAKASGLVVATNSVETLTRLASCPGIEPVLVGGRLNVSTDNFVGPLARRCIENLAFDAAYFSAYAMDAQVGLCEPALEDAEVKDWVQQRSARCFVAMNHEKFGQRATGVWKLDSEVSVLATDLPPDDEHLRPYRDLFSEVI